MPKSKRSKVFNLTKTDKKSKELKTNLVEEIRKCVDDYSHIYLFSVENMRNNALKAVRNQWPTSRFFLGKNKVMAKAFGESPEEELRPGLHLVAEQLTGNVGLLFSNETVETVQKFFEEYSVQDYARTGCIATETFTLPSGPLKRGEDAMPHNMEVQLRTLGLPTVLVNGVVTLSRDHVVCSVGEKLTPYQAQLLKHFFIQMAEFKIRVLGYWSEDKEWTSFVSEESAMEM